MSCKVLRCAWDAADDSKLCVCGYGRGSNSSKAAKQQSKRRRARSGSDRQSQVTEIYLILFLILLLLPLLLVSIKIQPSFGSVALSAGFWQRQTDSICLRLWLHMRLHLLAMPPLLLYLHNALLFLFLLFSLIWPLIFAELLSHQQPPILWIAVVCCTLHSASPPPLLLIPLLLPLRGMHAFCLPRQCCAFNFMFMRL